MKNKHMTINERIKIQLGLESGHSFKKIAEDTGKDCTSISREVRKHITVKRTGSPGRAFNDCVHRKDCLVLNHECTDDGCSRNSCAYCKRFCMTAQCRSYVKETCSRLKKAPYVCNGCGKVPSCQLEKHFYYAKDSQQKYETLLSTARSGFAIEEEEAAELGGVLRKGLSNGHSVYHIIQSVGEEAIGYSSKTIYTYISAGVFDGVGNIDLPRKVRYKARRNTYVQRFRRTDQVGTYVVKVAEGYDATVAADDIEQYLDEIAGEDYYRIFSPATVKEMSDSVMSAFSMFLAAIAAISLVVGGIGIMNIMMVSVVERTGEIGIRKALGATEKAIRSQFLTESVVLSASGGLIGLAAGIAISSAAAGIAGWSLHVSAGAVASSLIFPLLIGIFFGWYPAAKAARLQPMEALACD